MNDYDRVLRVRWRLNLNEKQAATLIGMHQDELQLIEAGLAVVQPEHQKRLCGLESLQYLETKRRPTPGAKPGGFKISQRRREALAWRWHHGLAHEDAAAALELSAEEYRMMETKNRVRLPRAVLVAMYRNRDEYPPL